MPASRPAPTPAAILAEPPEPAHQDIPREAWDRRDVGFLQGCWDLQSDYKLQNRETGEIDTVRSWTMCFDGQGTGE